MKDTLRPRHRPVLERLARSRTLLAFDYDGVLAPVVTDPRGAHMRRSTRQLLARVAELWPCAIVSGRSWHHTRELSEAVVPVVVGNHGFELGRARAVPRDVLLQVRDWREALERELAGMRGVYFEDKRSTLAVHYGLERRWRSVKDAVHRAAGRLEGARLVNGKKVLNVIPAGFPNKGDAIRALLRKLRLDVALYAGDDVTDEDAFALGPALVVGVRVGAGRSRAPFRLAAQEQMEDLLGILLALRSDDAEKIEGDHRPGRYRRAARRPSR